MSPYDISAHNDVAEWIKGLSSRHVLRDTRVEPTAAKFVNIIRWSDRRGSRAGRYADERAVSCHRGIVH